MKLVFEKLLLGDKYVMLLPRAVFDPTDTVALAQKEISLSRKEGGCLYALGALPLHDGHAPRFLPDGSSPQESSAPDVTLADYQGRIVAAVVAANGGNPVEVETIEKKIEPPKIDDFESGDEIDDFESGDGSGEDDDDDGEGAPDGGAKGPEDDPDKWKKYGLQ